MNGKVIRMWKAKYDTARIAEICRLPEAEVYRMVVNYQNVLYALRKKGEAA